MKKVKAMLAVVLAGAMMAGQFGCAPQKTTPPATSAPASTAESSQAASGDASAPASGEATTISFWKWIPVDGLQTDSLTEAWQKQFPNITLDITHVGEAEALFQKLSAALAAGEGPSVLALQPGARANQFKEFCEPLKPMAETRWGADWEKKFLTAALEQCRYSGDDYSVLPGGMTATPVIQYNAGVFKKLGIDKAPDTLDDVYAAIEKCKTDPQIIPGVGIGAKEGWTCRDVFMGIVNQVAPGKIYEAQDGKAKFTDPEIVEALTIWKDLFDKGFFAEGSLGTALYPTMNDNFNLAGTDGSKYYVMESNGTWHGSSMTKSTAAQDEEKGTRAPDLRLGAFTMPVVKEGAEKNMVVTVDVCWGVNNAKPQAEKDAAFNFVAWMAAEEGQEIWCNTLQVLPCALGVSLDKAMGDLVGDTEQEALKMFQNYVENNAGAREIRYPEIANSMNDVLPAVAGGMMSPEDAAAQMQAASDSVAR